MGYAKTLLATLAISTLLVAPAAADWNVGDPCKMHYPQLPSNDPNQRLGLDVLASQQQVPGTTQWNVLLADDWRCTATGPVSDIHIWGSWFKPTPYQTQPDPTAQFKLSIHSNVEGPPSQPGPELWSTIISPTQYTRRLWAGGYLGHVWDPNYNGGILGNDADIWQYNFTDLPAAYVQQQGTIYWLDVQVLSPEGRQFGWTTTDPTVTGHFMDDAVYSDTYGFNGPLWAPGWAPLVYPAGHPYAGLSIDLAFVITPEPGTLSLLAMGTLALIRRRRAA